jgi:RNA polymerase sigma factor (sigma-70 family)
MSAEEPSTHASLFQKLSDPQTHRDALDEFYRRYYQFILDRCGRLVVNQHDLEDLAHDVVLHLITKLVEFNYDPERSFRGWIAVIAHHKCVDKKREQGNVPGAVGKGGEDSNNFLENLESELQHTLPDDYRKVLDTFEISVKNRVEEDTWKCYELTVKEKLSAKEVAQKLGFSSYGKVHQYNKRVQIMLFKEIQQWKIARKIDPQSH